MKQSVFVHKNEAKWKMLESFSNGIKKLSADDIAKYYIEITDDLAYARTHYPDSHLLDYLNRLAYQLHATVYSNKKATKSQIGYFWKTAIPLAVYKRKKEMLTSLLIFLIAIVVGVFSTAMKPDFPRLILGDGYVNKTEENILKGDPMAVYKGDSQASMLVGIGSNNIRVSFLVFVVGIFASIFSGYILFSNGIMVGSFIYFFAREGIFGLSFTTIMIHGTLELSAIVIAGAAGIVLGNSWMFPGTYSRKESLIRGSKDSVKILISLIPVFIAAAILESYVTRHYLAIGMIGRLTIMILSTIYLAYYYIYLPRRSRKVSENLNS